MAKRNLARIPTAQSGPTVRKSLVRSKEAQSIGTEVARWWMLGSFMCCNETGIWQMWLLMKMLWQYGHCIWISLVVKVQKWNGDIFLGVLCSMALVQAKRVHLMVWKRKNDSLKRLLIGYLLVIHVLNIVCIPNRVDRLIMKFQIHAPAVQPFNASWLNRVWSRNRGAVRHFQLDDNKAIMKEKGHSVTGIACTLDLWVSKEAELFSSTTHREFMRTHNSTGTCYFCEGALWEMSFLYCKDEFCLCAVTLLMPVGISCSRGAERHH